MADGQLTIDIKGDDSSFSKTVKGLAGTAQSSLGAAAASGGKLTTALSGAKMAAAGLVANLGTQAINAAGQAMASFASSVVATGAQFQSSMSKVRALSGASAEDMEKLEAAAKKMGSTTKYTASESADALGYMALAGWDAEQSVAALPGVLNLAAASGMDLAHAADMCTDYMSAFGIEADQAGYFADQLAYAQANSNTSADQLGQAYKNCAANLHAAGQDMETTTSFLAMMANQGLKGSEAGTALAAVMRDITARMEDGAIQIGETSVAVTDAVGNFRDLTDIMADVEAATDGMGDAERAAALQSTFTADSIKGLNLIMNAGVGAAAEFEEGLRGSAGAAAEMAYQMSNNLAGDITYMQSALDGLKLSIFDSVESPMRSVVQVVTNEFLPAMTAIVNGDEETATSMMQVRMAAKMAGVSNNDLAYAFNQVSDTMAGFGQTTSSTNALLAGLMKNGKSCTESVDILTKATEAMFAASDNGVAVVNGVNVALWDENGNYRDLTDILHDCHGALQGLTNEEKSAAMAAAFGADNEEVLRQAFNSSASSAYGMSDALDHAGGSTALLNAAMYDMVQNVLATVSEMAPTVIDTVMAMLQAVAELVPDFAVDICEMLIAQLPAFTEAALTLFSGLVEAIPPTIEALLGVMPDVVSSVGEFLSGSLPLVLEAATAMLQGLCQAVPAVVSEVAALLPEIVNTICQFFVQNIDSVLQAAIQMLMALVNAIPEIVSALTDNMPAIIDAIVVALVNALPQIMQAALQMFLAIVQAIPQIATQVVEAIPTIIVAIVGALINNIPNILSTAIQMFGAIVMAIPQIIGNLIAGLGQIGSTIMDRLRSINLLDIGKNIIQGLINGITSMVGNILSTVGNLASRVMGAFAGILGIHSPSTVFKAYGEYIDEGAEQGIDKGARNVVRAMSNMAGDVVDAGLDGLAGSGSMAISSAAQATTNGAAAAAASAYRSSDLDASTALLARIAKAVEDGKTIVFSATEAANALLDPIDSGLRRKAMAW